jgi:oxalate decarboxylase/phosphoglucose isomerase-like protein (cupin superfamily)
MENFCQIGKLEKKDGYDVCRDIKRQGNLRYDLTKLLPGCHTLGHYHLPQLPELFEVLSGQAVFLIQRNEETYAIEAEEKEKIIVLPDFSIRTINSSNIRDLIVSNWIDDKVKNIYNAFENIPEPIKLKPKKFLPELENLEFLTQPEKYKDILTIENLYKII